LIFPLSFFSLRLRGRHQRHSKMKGLSRDSPQQKRPPNEAPPSLARGGGRGCHNFDAFGSGFPPSARGAGISPCGPSRAPRSSRSAPSTPSRRASSSSPTTPLLCGGMDHTSEARFFLGVGESSRQRFSSEFGTFLREFEGALCVCASYVYVSVCACACVLSCGRATVRVCMCLCGPVRMSPFVSVCVSGRVFGQEGRARPSRRFTSGTRTSRR